MTTIMLINFVFLVKTNKYKTKRFTEDDYERYTPHDTFC